MSFQQSLTALFGSTGFIAVGFSSFYYTGNGFYAAICGVATCVVMAFIGRQIGHILDHPMGRRGRPSKFFQELFANPFGGSLGGGTKGPKGPMTGDEIFLDDLGP